MSNHVTSTATESKSRKSPAPRTVMGRVKLSYPRIRCLLVPLDFSGKSRQALRYATPLAQKFSAKIALLHVLPPARGAKPEAPGFVPVTRAIAKSAHQRLEEMARTLIPPTQRGPNCVRIGVPADEILATAGKLDVDIIVLTTHGRTGLKRFFVGSTAEQVMRQASCPVLSVRRH